MKTELILYTLTIDVKLEVLLPQAELQIAPVLRKRNEKTHTNLQLQFHNFSVGFSAEKNSKIELFFAYLEDFWRFQIFHSDT